ncbi:RING-H2 finger protein, partial [bacterium]|nr:RING-H2 finger protein [Candidatus Elulimicrobium humile]
PGDSTTLVGWCALSRRIGHLINLMDYPERSYELFEEYFNGIVASKPSEFSKVLPSFTSLLEEFYVPQTQFALDIVDESFFDEAFILYLIFNDTLNSSIELTKKWFDLYINNDSKQPPSFINSLYVLGWKYIKLINKFIIDCVSRIQENYVKDEIIERFKEYNFIHSETVTAKDILYVSENPYTIDRFYDWVYPVPTFDVNINDLNVTFKYLHKLINLGNASVKEETMSRFFSEWYLESRQKEWEVYLQEANAMLVDLHRARLEYVTKQSKYQIPRKTIEEIIQLYPNLFSWETVGCFTDNVEGEDAAVYCSICQGWIEPQEPVTQMKCCLKCTHKDCLIRWINVFYVRGQHNILQPECPNCTQEMIKIYIDNDA